MRHLSLFGQRLLRPRLQLQVTKIQPTLRCLSSSRPIHDSALIRTEPGTFVDYISTADNVRYTVSPDGQKMIDLDFVEEPLGLYAKHGYGYANFKFEETLVGRYVVKRKLGWGSTSSSWLALDKQEDKFVVIKALTGNATTLATGPDSVIWELPALRRLASTADGQENKSHCLSLLSHFTLPSRESWDGDHLSFVTPLYGGDVKQLWHIRRYFPLPLVKRIALHTLRGLAFAHRHGVAHTDLKHDNIFFTSSLSRADIDAVLENDPPRRNRCEASPSGDFQSAVSQPLPLPTLEAAMGCEFVLADFGSAELDDGEQLLEITALALRPPEIFFGSPWDEMVDIWTLGCLVCEFAVGKPLFRHEDSTSGPGAELGPVVVHLCQMMSLTRQEFPKDYLYDGYHDIFTSEHDFKAATQIVPPLKPVRELLEDARAVEDKDELDALAAFINRCLQLDFRLRPSAQELLHDPLFEGVD